MKNLIPVLLVLFIPATLFSQSFDEALGHFRAERYTEAATLFSQLEDERSSLFAGKSYLSLFEYTLANSYLYRAYQTADDSRIREEAAYSLGQSHFHLKNFDKSLEYLHQLIESDNRTGLRNDARRLYFQILDYLSRSQRFDTLFRLQNPSVRYDLTLRSRSFLDSDSFQLLVDELIKMTSDEREKMRLKNELSRSQSSRSVISSFPIAPIGTVYHVGVILPEFDENDPEFSISRNLYFGMLLAAEDLNSRNIDQKVKLSFRNSAENTDTTARAFIDLVAAHKADAIIGPLFSEPASRLASLSEEFQIPMIAPLANSDQLNRDYNYTFQINPTFEMHGRAMARFAVQELRLDTLAIITEKDSPSRLAALGFRHEAEKLGAHISYYIDEDFASTGYDLTDVMEVFTTDQTLTDSLRIVSSKAVYAPFTGQASTTLMNLMLNDLEARGNNPVILGGADWESAELTPFQERYFQIYYTSTGVPTAYRPSEEFFIEDYRSRFGLEPDYFSRIGYDTATYLFNSLERAGNPVYLTRALRTGSIYHGFGTSIHFNEGRINQRLHIHPLSESAKNRLNR
ncbi:MAG: amino acid ABC transporter substrate-binding protein [Balneolaceae bacterium]|nr:MAG: amino acid ABC transporter substrate-binding protein [Balneolaceae bacterium]